MPLVKSANVRLTPDVDDERLGHGDRTICREDLVIGGTTIPRDALVYAVLASANRDERQLEQPNTLDLNPQLNRHVAFGQGIHFCLGAPLARLEGQIAIQTLLERTHDLRLILSPDKLRWQAVSSFVAW